MEAFQRAKRNTQKPLHVTGYCNLINDLLQRGTPRRDFAGDFVGLCVGFKDMGLPREDAMEIVDAVTSVVNELWPSDESHVAPMDAHVMEEKAEAHKDVEEVEFIRDPSPPRALRLLKAHRRYEEQSRPLVRAAERVLHGGSAA
jgi:hypothetical protein